MNNKPLSQKSNMVIQVVEQAVLDDNLNNHPRNPKPLKRMRVCLRCQANLTKKHKCVSCGLRFHDGPLLGWLKRLWGVAPI